MRKVAVFRRARGMWPNSFTLVELLVVIAIIVILVALVLAASSGVMNAVARNRARSEIQAMSAALESYKTDNGAYPLGYPASNSTASSSSALLGPPSSSYALDSSLSGGSYQLAAQALYEALAGKVNYYDTPVAGTRTYMTFRPAELGNGKTTAGTAYNANTATYVRDPWSYAYGYSTGDGNLPYQTQYPYNSGVTNSVPGSAFDLWSTGGTIAATTTNPNPTNSWIVNWK